MNFKFYNQYNYFLYEGTHASEEEAWIGFWDKCQYPAFARNKEECKRAGIRCEKQE